MEDSSREERLSGCSFKDNSVFVRIRPIKVDGSHVPGGVVAGIIHTSNNLIITN